MHAGRVFLPHIAALPEIDAVQLFRIGFKPERLIGTKLCYAFRHPKPQPMRAPGGGMVGACRICWSKPAMSQFRQAGVCGLFCFIGRPMHGPAVIPHNLALPTPPITGKPPASSLGLSLL